MDPRITFTFTILGLLVTIIAQRDKLLSFFDDLKKRLAVRSERKRALAIISKFTDPDSKRQPSLLVLYIPVFLISILSSVAVSYLGLQPQFHNTIVSSSTIHLSISMIVLVTFLVTSRRFEWLFIIALFIGVFMVSTLWGILIIIIERTGLATIWSGVIAGIGVILFLLDADRRSNRQSRRQSLK